MPRKPMKFDQSIADKICEMVADGIAMETICNTKGIPSRTIVYRWLQEEQSFREDYARAREQRADRYADEIIQIADTEEDAARARNRIDARKWVAGKYNPSVYGDRTTIAGTGNKDDAIHVEGSGLVETLIGRLAGIASRE